MIIGGSSGKVSNTKNGFTIVELVIVIVVIAILATISILGYTGLKNRAVESGLQSELRSIANKIHIAKAENGQFPTPNLPSSISGTTNNYLQYTSDGNTFCITITSSSVNTQAYNISDSSSLTSGACSGHNASLGQVTNGTFMQTIGSANCPTARTRVVDARDGKSYWIQKLADDKCWMLTNLAYSGGGTNTYGDVKSLTNGNSGGIYFSDPRYYIPASGSNPTSDPTNPSTAINGTGQYGYLYNWCAAIGGQLATSGCANSASPLPNQSISICPSGWRLPTGGASSEFQALNTAVNNGSATSSAGLLTTWLGQNSGYWSSGFNGQSTLGLYWSSTQKDATYVLTFYYTSTSVSSAYDGGKYGGAAVRCTL